METKKLILHRPIAEVASSEEFLKMCDVNNFKSLNEIIALTINEMLRKPKFNLRSLKELYKILKRHHLEGCI
jgi:DNA-directed RNA polymerase alpha subunit